MGGGHLCGGEKQEKEKNEMKCELMKMKWKEENLKKKKTIIEKYYHNIFTINFK